MIRSASGLLSSLISRIAAVSSGHHQQSGQTGRKVQRSIDCGPSCAPDDASVKLIERDRAGPSSAQVPPAHPSWNVSGNEAALRSTNPIRKVVDALGEAVLPDDRPLITLAIGDPTAYEFISAPSVATEALIGAVASGAYNGYGASAGLTECRAAVATYHNAQLPLDGPQLAPSDVFMTSGASQALQLAIAAVSNPGCNILLPQPGFPLYQTLCEYYGVEFRFYNLLPERNWEADIRHIESLTDTRTVALILCNPSNPCGSVWSADHLRELLAAAGRLRLVVIADEVYADIVFADGAKYFPAAALSADTPVLSVGALSKRWIVPGWRVGWLLLHDRGGAFAQSRVAEALTRMAQISIGPTVPVQAAVPTLLFETPKAWYASCLSAYRSAAELCERRAGATPGLGIDAPVAGAMYLLLRLDVEQFPGVSDDVAFAAALQKEEGLVLLPGSAFRAPGRVRLVLCVPLDTLSAAWDRLEAFCARHHRDAVGQLGDGDGAGLKLLAPPAPAPPPPATAAAEAEAVGLDVTMAQRWVGGGAMAGGGASAASGGREEGAAAAAGGDSRGAVGEASTSASGGGRGRGDAPVPAAAAAAAASSNGDAPHANGGSVQRPPRPRSGGAGGENGATTAGEATPAGVAGGGADCEWQGNGNGNSNGNSNGSGNGNGTAGAEGVRHHQGTQRAAVGTAGGESGSANGGASAGTASQRGGGQDSTPAAPHKKGSRGGGGGAEGGGRRGGKQPPVKGAGGGGGGGGIVLVPNASAVAANGGTAVLPVLTQPC